VGHAQPSPAVAAGSASVPGRPWALALFTIIIGAFMSILDSTIVNIAVPAIMHDFNTNTQGVQWVLTIYLLALGVVTPLSGWLGDRYGYKRVYMLALVIFTVGSALSGLSWSIASLTAARVIQAVGGGLIMPVTTAMVYSIVPRDRLGTAMGFYGLTLLFAPAVGPTLGGYLVQYVNWRLVFTINIPIGVAGLILSSLFIQEIGGRVREPLDRAGFLTSAVGLFALLFALSEGETYGWGSELIVGLLFLSAVALILFVWVELRADHPLINLGVFTHPTFVLSLVIGVITTVALYGGSFYIPLYLQTVRGFGALTTGLVLMPGAIASGFMMPVAGRIYDRAGAKGVALVGLVVLAYGTYLFHHLSVTTTAGTVRDWMVVRGLGMGLVMMPVMTAGLSAIPQPMLGRASAVSNIVQRVSGSLGIAVLTTMLTSLTSQHFAGLAMQTGAGAMRQAMPANLPPAAAMYLLYGRLQQQAFTLAINDMFVLMAAVAVLGLIPALMLRRGTAVAGPRPVAGLE
jgi:EmrB/QacA subfamily drug resistance transporter